MNKQLLKVIERAIQSDHQIFPLNQSWAFLHQQYNVGRTQGNKLEVTQQDKDELLALVKLETGVDLGQISVTDFAAMNREEALAFALDEKIAGQAVKKDRLAIKTLAEHTLKINGKSFTLPGSGYLDMALADITSMAHRCIVLIENYRCFDRLENMQLNLPDQYIDPLVLFRGDNYYSENTVRRFLADLNLPVLIMSDLDPRGLIIAQSFPNVIGLIAPCLADFEALFKDQQKANPKLYEKQFASCQNALSNSPHALIRHLWEMMKTHQAGIVQEYWLQAGCELVVHNMETC
ncbi:MAG: hypothetical protein PHD43_15800 [Methylococcales bacterium]|nr:hypothetical protein [Methylococcales bacterium]